MRKLVISLVVVLALLVVADRVSLHLAERAVAEQARKSGHLTSTPKVTAHGFPFLTQVVRGRYARIDLQLTDLDRGGVRMSRLSATLEGAQVPLADAISGNVKRIPVDSLDATVLVDYTDLARASGLSSVSVTPEDGEVRVTAQVTVLGQTVRASALSRVSLKDGRIALTATSLRVLGQNSPRLVNALAGTLDVVIRVGTLPYNLTLTGVDVRSDGVELTARSGPTVLITGV